MDDRCYRPACGQPVQEGEDRWIILDPSAVDEGFRLGPFCSPRCRCLWAEEVQGLRSPEPVGQDELFYVGYRELFEKPDRKGYTKNKAEAGKWPLWAARKMTSNRCAHGFGRWYISCSALDSFDGSDLHPTELY